MALAAHQQPPISKLPRDILWEIFSIDLDTDSNPKKYPEFKLSKSPLTNTLQSSQVCRLWREIIYESPSIWGNCLDLDALKRYKYWTPDDVLQMAGNALLAVRYQHEPRDHEDTSEQAFVTKVICEHWERIKLLDIYIADDMADSDGVKRWQAFCGPAPALQVFALHRRDPLHKTAFIDVSIDAQLFGGHAPLLACFSIDEDIVPERTINPIPTTVLSSNLRRLALYQPVFTSGSYLLDVIEQVPLLEELVLCIANVTPVESERLVFHRSLDYVNIFSTCLQVYSAFLGHLSVRPSKRAVTICLDSFTDSPATLEAYAQNIRNIILRDAGNFFEDNTFVAYLEVSLSSTEMSVLACQKNGDSISYFNFAFQASGWLATTSLPFIILQSFVTILTTLRLPPTIRIFKFTFPKPSSVSRLNLPHLSPLFNSLNGLIELDTTPDSIAYINERSESEGVTFFDTLKVVALRDADISGFDEQVAAHCLCAFLVTLRQGASPVEVLDLNSRHAPLGDLRPLDAIVGLKVVWASRSMHWHHDKPQFTSRRREYVCGSGQPEKLREIIRPMPSEDQLIDGSDED
ncbi:hypothetical protein BDN70DRAFT_883146 [Pholiota conissans]|uniref:F-box domain-containing protein n=1 Tax=Pholiota conissans TaxID=109636 RepID=A0A9P6CXR5_9AGAR|nr:hypothetical protein BDN70DRAFT_883146 [Pholiota conissans]